jgi:8-oxo-dGTP pyrophosphatase MutT (NUDIX family)
MAGKEVFGVGVILENPDEYPGKILFVKEKRENKSIGKSVGDISLPSGHLDSDLTVIETVLQEIKEETGYTEVELLGVLRLYHIKGAVGIVYIGVVSGDRGQALKEEISNVFWADPYIILGKNQTGTIRLRPGTEEVLEDFLSNRPPFPLDIIKECR